MTATKRAGRPAGYSDAQVLAAVAALEAEGAAPTAEAVKRILVEEHDVSGGINVQSLQERMAVLIEVRDRERRMELILALPPEARERARVLAAQMEAGMLDHLALSHDGLRAVAAEQLVEREADLRIVRQQLGAAEAALAAAEKAAAKEVARLEAENARLRDALAAEQALSKARQTTVDARDAEIARLRHEQVGREQMMMALQDMFGDRRTLAFAGGTAVPEAGADPATVARADEQTASRAKGTPSPAAAGSAPHLAAE